MQFKKREKHPWRSVTFSKVAGSKPASILKVITPPWVFFTFFELYKWYQIAQNITGFKDLVSNAQQKKCATYGALIS